nr:putative ribonuclease H-like domain-containing protein [Tanacetum cinerariifolium]
TKDETSGTLKSFITRVENLMNLKIKVIICDNGTELKNREMNRFYEVKGIMRQYSIARTPQQNRVAKRRNRTLIEAARTMLADLKMPTTFWAKVVNTACYVQNRVLVTKPHNKTPYELFHASSDARKEKEPDRDYILLPLWTADSTLSTISKSSQDNEFQPLNDGAKRVDEDLSKENKCNDQGEEDSTNNTNRVNTVTSNINAASSSGVNVVEADFHNLDSTFQVSLIPITRIHKDHPLKQVIRDLHSTPQTRRMSKNLEEHGLVGTKDETSGTLKSFITRVENLMNLKIKVIICDNGTELKNREMNRFYEVKGIMRQYSIARTPQQNRVAKRRNRTLIEAARTMLADLKMPTTFWAKVVNTACYVQNRVLVTKPHNKTPYELFHASSDARKEKEPDRDYILLPLWTADSTLYPDDLLMPDLEDARIFGAAYDDDVEGAEADFYNLELTQVVSLIPTTRVHKDHPKEQIIGEVYFVVQTRGMAKQNEAGL